MAEQADLERDTDEGSDLISKRAELFRWKLLTHFQLLDRFTDNGYQKDRGVVFNPNDIIGTEDGSSRI